MHIYIVTLRISRAWEFDKCVQVEARDLLDLVSKLQEELGHDLEDAKSIHIQEVDKFLE